MPSANLTTAINALRVLTLDELNDVLPVYKQLLSVNRRIESSVAIMSFKPGDAVVLHDIRPKHMNGVKGEVISVKQTKVLAKFPNTQWSFGVNVPATCLTKLDA